jgi:hypothetical protein
MKKIGLLEFLTMVCERKIEEENLANYLMDKITLAGGEMQKVMLCINWIKI